MTAVTVDDEGFMAQAIAVARRHLGQTSTNPSVGCVIVRDGAVVGSAVTAIGGRPHAEPQALAEAGEAARGATAYVTLEPCSHYGRTPPCANALIAAGVGRVVVSVTDPDARVAGRGLAMLRAGGITVDTGVLEKEGARSLAGYLMRQTQGRPHVTLKIAVSADGMIGRLGDGQVAITGAEARAEVQQLRAESDAILVGIGTAIADDPLLTCREPGLEQRSPIRVVLDRRLELPLGSKLAMTARDVPVIDVGLPHGEKSAALRALGIEVLEQDPADLATLLSTLGGRGISSLLVEGGARTARSFLDAGLVDRILLFQAPISIGAGGLASPVTSTNIPATFKLISTAHFGRDRCDTYERDV
ncbi:bifunctional diaminohydroxyphosphoribosylaminopyrimidine deaminase/5-amino-6-(5-phosphoribosylamino)uracil reductase RibD [Rhizobium sp. HT1-10]|uniref:bifunctional diaminohydroxyphosphoribosylaminopyrimidine deaminase/5-amino-6-(5-phosphoribosylamino)uracil reductase RibD n=1 Tax=Rhizobium sp. HT1-10 TaxID=3111638 RepID=UPI003C245947